MNNKSVFDIKEQSLEKLKSLEKLDPDFVFSWLGGLTDLEQKIISVLYICNKASTIKDVVSSLIRNTYSVLASKDYPVGIKFLKEFDFPFNSYCFESIDGIDENIKQKISSLKRLEAIDTLKKEIKFPSFRRIDKTIQDLITMGIILKREEPSKNKKIKGYYFLNPIIRSQLNKLKKEKI